MRAGRKKMSLTIKLLGHGAEAVGRTLGKLCFQTSQEAPPLVSFFSSRLRSFQLGKQPGQKVNCLLGDRKTHPICGWSLGV